MIFSETVFSEIASRSILKYSWCSSFTMAGNLIVLSSLLSLSVGVTSSFKKCCPFGEVFSGITKVNCIQAPPRATQVFLSNLDNGSIIYGELPVCEEVEHITTLFLDELNLTEIVQVHDSLIDFKLVSILLLISTECMKVCILFRKNQYRNIVLFTVYNPHSFLVLIFR